MTLLIGPGDKVGRDGGSFQECSIVRIDSDGVEFQLYKRFCTIRDNEKAPPTSKPDRKWKQIFRTPDSEF